MAPFPPVFFEKLFVILTSNSCDQAVRAAGYTCDFMPDVGVQRGGAGEQTLSGDTVIEEGDLCGATLASSRWGSGPTRSTWA